MAKTRKKSTKSPSLALVITQKQAKRLTPNQAAFNRLTARFEKLRADLERKEKQLDRALKRYGETLPPLDAQLAQACRGIMLTILPLYEQKKFSKTLLPQLKMLLQDLLYQVLEAGTGEPDAELKDLFQKLEGESYDAVAARERRAAESENPGRKDMEPEDIPLSEEMEARQKREERSKSRSGNARQSKWLQREKELKEARQKNISTIYKQLAKILHPDLEQDEQRRLEKEELMKELTEAYEADNLHKLLLLEGKWIHRESSHLELLADEKLAVYVEILQEQVKEMESRKHQVLHQPRYYALVERYGFGPLPHPEKTVEEDIAFTQMRILQMQAVFKSLQTPEALQHLKQILALRKEKQ